MVVSSDVSSDEVSLLESTTGGSVDSGGSVTGGSTGMVSVDSTGSSIMIGIVVVSGVVESVTGFVVSTFEVSGFFVDVTLESSFSAL